MAVNSERKFEDELADLEAVVTRIDSGELSLEDSISAFERGVALVRSLNQKLDQVDRRVEILTRGPHGELNSAPFERDDSAADLANGQSPATTRNGPKDDDDIPF
ncbi:MAG TPA: exodeoxyribonuclease VII small subunit [Candidatus Binataceae bacterium]|nr:exodeoxyribonuclease VII small subunit [Candidatus Binataceae bacterium]